ncbi:MAG: MFS transporter [Oscillospiraceae bacterium]|nr:MFS transporter [Oscillospiraceae bacterium]
MEKTSLAPLKLNVRRTSMIGFAFFGILLLWQVYDSWCPTFLTDIFARHIYEMSSAELKASDPARILNVQWIVGIIMACDNLAALILLPIFGNLSDKTDTPIGKRMPYILVGTFVSAVAFPFIPLFFHHNNMVGMVITMAIVLIFMMMYRNPAVALMPDITPKPLRARANGIINIMGYLGGAFATVLGILFVLSSYINAPVSERNIWTIEMPFIIASVLMVISALVLFATIKENKIEEEIRDELELGEKLAAVETPIDDDKPMSRANKTMLLAILGAEFLWFMSDNALGSYEKTDHCTDTRSGQSGTTGLRYDYRERYESLEHQLDPAQRRNPGHSGVSAGRGCRGIHSNCRWTVCDRRCRHRSCPVRRGSASFL